jgi:hypothetical protein
MRRDYCNKEVTIEGLVFEAHILLYHESKEEDEEVTTSVTEEGSDLLVRQLGVEAV